MCKTLYCLRLDRSVILKAESARSTWKQPQSWGKYSTVNNIMVNVYNLYMKSLRHLGIGLYGSDFLWWMKSCWKRIWNTCPNSGTTYHVCWAVIGWNLKTHDRHKWICPLEIHTHALLPPKYQNVTTLNAVHTWSTGKQIWAVRANLLNTVPHAKNRVGIAVLVSIVKSYLWQTCIFKSHLHTVHVVLSFVRIQGRHG